MFGKPVLVKEEVKVGARLTALEEKVRKLEAELEPLKANTFDQIYYAWLPASYLYDLEPTKVSLRIIKLYQHFQLRFKEEFMKPAFITVEKKVKKK